MFYGSEENNYGSKEMTVNYIDELITTKILKASGFFEYHAKTIIVTLHEALQ
ncbi:uncharacterized protein METZ01_LOCUS371899 [marine metagenome]|uniref:Uncharacterized protein n=1 Tax=marine metagenome TaxID=408172 RepID=A0A382TB71_9ZZZZ